MGEGGSLLFALFGEEVMVRSTDRVGHWTLLRTHYMWTDVSADDPPKWWLFWG